jgi:hypothetical protein
VRESQEKGAMSLSESQCLTMVLFEESEEVLSSVAR